MRRLVIHAGIHRTGTTTLQRTLASSRELLMQSGYCYPGRKEHHQELVFAIKRKEMSDQAVFNYITQDCGDAHTIIISGEDFCTLTDLSFLSHLKKYFEVEAHIVLRRQDDWLMSWYNQHVRWPHAPNKYKMTPEQFLRTLPDYAWLYFDDLGLRWRRHLGAENLDTSGNLLLRGAHGPIGFGFDIAVGLKGLFPLRPWPFEGGFAPVPPSWGHVEAILSSQHHRFML